MCSVYNVQETILHILHISLLIHPFLILWFAIIKSICTGKEITQGFEPRR